MLTDLAPEEAVALLSALVFQEKVEQEPGELPEGLQMARAECTALARELAEVQVRSASRQRIPQHVAKPSQALARPTERCLSHACVPAHPIPTPNPQALSRRTLLPRFGQPLALQACLDACPRRGRSSNVAWRSGIPRSGSRAPSSGASWRSSTSGPRACPSRRSAASQVSIFIYLVLLGVPGS